jgi:hypothetical protein
LLLAGCYEEHLAPPAPPHPIRTGRILSMAPKQLRVDLFDAGLPGPAANQDFRVAEAGVVRTGDPETVQYLARPDEKIALLLDYSSSMNWELVEAQARNFLSRLTDNQKVALYSFADVVRRESIYTFDKKFLTARLDCARLDLATEKSDCVREPWARRKGILRTDVFQALAAAAADLPRVDVDRHVIVVVTDGRNDIHNVTLAQTVHDAVVRLGVPVFILDMNAGAANPSLAGLAALNAGEYIAATDEVGAGLGFDRITAAITPAVTLVYQAYDAARGLPLTIALADRPWQTALAVDVAWASASALERPVVIAQVFGGEAGGTSRLDLDAVYFPSQVTQVEAVITWRGDVRLKLDGLAPVPESLDGLPYAAAPGWTLKSYGEWQDSATQPVKAVAFAVSGVATKVGQSGRLLSIPALVSPGLDAAEVHFQIALRINGRTYLDCVPAQFVNLARPVPAAPAACVGAADSDGDGKTDWAEALYGGNPGSFYN